MGPEFEDMLGSKLGWGSLIYAAKERTDATNNFASHDHGVAKYICPAKREDITVDEAEEGEESRKDLRSQTSERIQEW